MALSKGKNPTFDTVKIEAQTLVPNSSQLATNSIEAGVTSVRLAANANGVTDFTVLPSLTSVPVGHVVTIVAEQLTQKLEHQTVQMRN